MRARRIAITGTVIAVAASVALGMSLYANHDAIAVSTPTAEIAVVTDDPLAEPQEASSLAPEARGVPAIRPRVSAAAGDITFEQSDVLTWLKGNPFAYRQPGKPAPQVVSIDFVAAIDASKRLQLPLNLPDDDSVCVVMLRGDFLVPGEDPPLSGTTGFIVFNATSGNIIVHGIKP